MPSFDRAKAERAARTVLMFSLAPVLPAGALLIWILGFEHGRHHVALALMIAVPFCVLVTVIHLLLYRNRIRQLASL
jgi:hypothetical protein